MAAKSSKPIVFLKAIALGVLTFAPLLLINVFQMISILWRSSKPLLFRQYNSFWAETYWTYVVWLAEKLGRLQLSFVGDPLPPGENAIVLINHQSAVDTVIQLAFGKKFGRLGDMKFFVKDAIKYIPGPGWGMILLDCIFMKRDWTRDRVNVLRRLQSFKTVGAPIWVTLYPEGTRMKPSKLAAAQDFARKQNLPLPHYVLIPRVKGFLASIEGLGEHVQAVYDLTIAYPDARPTTFLELLSSQGRRATIEIKRYPLVDLPKDAEGRSEWLMQVYRDKEAQMQRLVKDLG